MASLVQAHRDLGLSQGTQWIFICSSHTPVLSPSCLLCCFAFILIQTLSKITLDLIHVCCQVRNLPSVKAPSLYLMYSVIWQSLNQSLWPIEKEKLKSAKIAPCAHRGAEGKSNPTEAMIPQARKGNSPKENEIALLLRKTVVKLFLS